MKGKIIKGIAGFYYVHVLEKGVYECKAKGIFRNRNMKPLVGDDVRIEMIEEGSKQGNVVEVFRRNNQLTRPAVANVDQVMAVFATANPEPNLYLLDRFLIHMEKENIPTVIGFNKTDVVDKIDTERIKGIYERSGYPILFFSVKEKENLNGLTAYIRDKTTVLAGPSGVGKSSLLNYLHPPANMEVGKVSDKNKRGKHTTRHSELFFLKEGYVMDTPGFSSFDMPDMEKEELRKYIPEFKRYEDSCKFLGCMHVNEPGCTVKEAVTKGEVNETRYLHYLRMYEELRHRKRF